MIPVNPTPGLDEIRGLKVYTSLAAIWPRLDPKWPFFRRSEPKNPAPQRSEASHSKGPDDGFRPRGCRPTACSQVPACPKGRGKGRQRGSERQRTIPECLCSITDIPSRCPLVLGVDDHQHAANLARDTDATQRGREQKLATKPPARHRFVHRQTRQQKSRHIVASQACGTCATTAVEGLRGPEPRQLSAVRTI